MDDARRQAAARAELAARESYGRLLSTVARRAGDIAVAEDALADAFAAALDQWPRDGVPGNPLGWLVVVARRSLNKAQARHHAADRAAGHLRLLEDEREQRREAAPNPFRDDRLALLFVCAHPAIETEAQAPLMLQSVLGLDAARIAAAFLVPPATMGQRLVRAKRKIRDAGIGFAIPGPEAIADRIERVLSAIYAAFGTAWDDVAGADARLAGLSGEALFLARLVAELAPGEPEALGLLSLLLHCAARQPARRTAAGGFVPLHDQDTALWNRPLMAEAEAALRRAAALGRPGRFQTEAAIQSLHVQQRLTGARLSAPLVQLYEVLAGFAPTAGVLVARAVAHAENGEPATALHLLDAVAGADAYQPWWAARARAAWLAGDAAQAEHAATIAAGLSSEPGIRRFLLDGGYRFAAPG